MSEEAKNTKLSRSEEIAELKRQMEQMGKRLEELSAQEAKNGSGNAVSPEGEALNATSEGACAASGQIEACKAELLGKDDEAVATVHSSEAQNAQPVVPAQPFQNGPVVAPGDAPEKQAAAQPEKSKGEKASAPGPIEKEPEFDAAYVAAAVEDFMPKSKPPQPAPPLQGVPGGPYSTVQRGSEQSQPHQAYAQQPGQAAYYQNAGASQGGYQGQYQQSYTPAKDHVAAGLLAIFLGVFGVHKFYLGYNTAGFILLGVTILGGIFTFGIAASVVWLIGLIEGVIYLTKSQTEFNQIYVYGKRDWF